MLGGLTLSDEVTTHSCTCASNPTPAMQVDPVPRLETFFDLMEDVIHPLRGGQAKIPNGKAIVDDFHVVGIGLLEQDVCIRDHFIDGGEIDECVEAGFDQGVEALT